jgi:hypothetical protein
MPQEHKNSKKMFDPVTICSECGEPLIAKAVHVHPEPWSPEILASACEGARESQKQEGDCAGQRHHNVGGGDACSTTPWRIGIDPKASVSINSDRFEP